MEDDLEIEAPTQELLSFEYLNYSSLENSDDKLESLATEGKIEFIS